MEYVIGGAVLWVWLSIGFGTRAVFQAAKHGIGGFPLLPIIWPIALMMAAYSPEFAGDGK